jgi:hypothetical protein
VTTFCVTGWPESNKDRQTDLPDPIECFLSDAVTVSRQNSLENKEADKRSRTEGKDRRQLRKTKRWTTGKTKTKNKMRDKDKRKTKEKAEEKEEDKDQMHTTDKEKADTEIDRP